MSGLLEGESLRKLEGKENNDISMDKQELRNGENNNLSAAFDSTEVDVVIEKVKLQRSITLVGTIAILVANIGGSGIFIIPTTMLNFAGSPGMTLIMWAVGGFIQLCLAFSVIEVALMFNKSGGPYYFIYQTFGSLAGFVFMWGFLIFIAAPSWALGAYTTSLYLLSIIYDDCLPADGLVKLVGVWIMVTLIAINCTYMKVVTRVQNFLTSCKILALVIIIILGLINIPTERGQENLNHFMDGTDWDVGKLPYLFLLVTLVLVDGKQKFSAQSSW